MPYSLKPHPSPQTGLRAQGNQAEPVPPPQAGLHRDQIGEGDEVSLGREIPLRRGYGLPPKGNPHQDVTGNPPKGLSQVRPGLASSQFGHEQSPGHRMETPSLLHPMPRPANQGLSSASWRNTEDAPLRSLRCLAVVENSL